MSDTFYISGQDSSEKLVRMFLAATIIDNGGSLNISRKAFSELYDEYTKNEHLHILAETSDDAGLDISIQWGE